jgi:hypothetical protein
MIAPAYFAKAWANTRIDGSCAKLDVAAIGTVRAPEPIMSLLYLEIF